MNVQTLTNVLLALMDKHGKDVEVRIGDQIEYRTQRGRRVAVVGASTGVI